MTIPIITYRIIYNNKDITRDISDHLLSLSYTDKVEGESDEIELELEDKDGLWQNDWYPTKGDSVEVQIIDGTAILNCGKFTLDEIKLKGSKSSGDTITLSGLAAVITKRLRTKKHTPHENKTLRQLAQYVADTHGLTVKGTIPDIRFSRITQNGETDLSFLNRMASQYGLLFSIRDTQLIFQDKIELEKKNHVLSLDKTDVTDYDFLDKTENTFKKANAKFHNPEKNESIEYDTADADEGYDTLTVRDKVETKQQAELKAKAALHKKNSRQQTCSITAPGNILLISGNNVELTGFGKLSSVAHITESKHKVDRSGGYVTSFDAKKVNKVEPAKYKPKKKKYSAFQSVNTAGGTSIRSVRDGGGTVTNAFSF